jgi:hypothetical protein
MIYSVWDHARRVYNYFETPNKSSAINAPKPGHLRAATLGMTPDEAAWPLPSDARLAGSGKYPKGRIAVQKRALAGLGILPDLTPANMILIGAVGFFVWNMVEKR